MAVERWWTGYGNGADNSRYFPATDQPAQRRPAAGGVDLSVRRCRSPIVHCTDAGATVPWSRSTQRPAKSCGLDNMNGMTTRGMNYWESADGRDQRLIFAMDTLLQEIDAKTGKSILSFGTNGVVDLRAGLDGRDPETLGNIQSSIPGEVFENIVIVGSATGEGYMSPPGDIRAYDVLSGKLTWTFHTVPRPGEFGYDTWPADAWKYVGGVNNWGEMTVDTRRGIVYIPLGSPTYDFYGADRAGSNLSGRRSSRSTRAAGSACGTSSSCTTISGISIRAPRRNRPRLQIGGAGATSWSSARRRRGCHVFDRVTGEPIWPIEERPVAKSDMPGEQSWPTQPYPTNPPPHARQSFGEQDISPYLPADEAAGSERGCSPRRTWVCSPQSTTPTPCTFPPAMAECCSAGRRRSRPTAPCYIVSHDNPGILRLLRPGEPAGRGGPPQPPGQVVYQQNCQSCHGPDRLGSDSVPPLVYAAADAANNIAAGAPRFDASAIRMVVAAGKGRMPPFPHLTPADVDAVVALLTTAPGARGQAAGGRGRGGPVGSGAPPELIVGAGIRDDASCSARRTRTRRPAAISGRTATVPSVR